MTETTQHIVHCCIGVSTGVGIGTIIAMIIIYTSKVINFILNIRIKKVTISDACNDNYNGTAFIISKKRKIRGVKQ